MARKIAVEIVGDARSLGRAFSHAEGRGASFGRTMETNARRAKIAFAAMGAGIGAGLISGSRQFSAFEQSLSRSVGLAGVAEKRVGGLRKELLKMGPEVGRGPRELGEAFYFVASAGVKAADQLDVVRNAGKAAAAGLGETQTVADAVTSAMNAYGSDVLSAAKATDVLVATVKEGKGEAASFAPVIGNVAALAAKMGVAFSDVGAALAAQTRLGTDAETAATQLQALFSGLLKTAPKAEKEMKKFHLSSKGLRTELREKGLLSVLKHIASAFGDNDEAMARAFPNIRALRGLLALVGTNAKDVEVIFKNLANSTGSLAHAFGAASKDEAFKFDQAKAAVEGAFIRIGAMAAPAAKLLAEGLGAGVDAFNNFLDKLSAAPTIAGKIDVVWDTAKDVGKKAQNAIGNAIKKVDWDAVWDKAQGIGDGLTKALDRTNWSRVGKTIGDGIRKAVARGAASAKELGSRLTDALRAIDWEELGKNIGPGLAAAVTTAFLALLDPGFWIRNWELALGVALVAFGGPIGRLAARAGTLFFKLGVDLVQRAALGLAYAFPKLENVILVWLPKAVKAGINQAAKIARFMFGGMIESIGNFFKRHRIFSFLVKVTGIATAIQVVSGLVSTIKGYFVRFFQWLERAAIRAALFVVEPFSHLPKKFGGWAQEMKRNLERELASMESSSKKTAKAIQRSINSVKGKTVTITITTRRKDDSPNVNQGMLPDRLVFPKGKGKGDGKGGGGTDPPPKPDPTPKPDPDAKTKKTAADIALEAAEDQKEAAEEAKQAWEEARDSAKQAFDGLFQGPIMSGLSGMVDMLRKFGGSLDPSLLLEDLRQSNQQSRKLLADLATISKRGAPAELVAELRGMGLGGAPIAAGLAGAPKDVFNQIVKAFGQREGMIKTAAMSVRADAVTIEAKSLPKWAQAMAVRGQLQGESMLRRASGGTVPGAGTGDTVPAMLTPGELVLNRRQQGGLSRVLGLGGSSPESLFSAIQRFASGGVVGNAGDSADAGRASKKKRKWTPRELFLRELYMSSSFGGSWVDRINRGFPKVMGKLDSAAAWITMAKPSDIGHAIKDPAWGWRTYMAYRSKTEAQMSSLARASQEALRAGDEKLYRKLQLQLTQMSSGTAPIPGVRTRAAAKVLPKIAGGPLQAQALKASEYISRNPGATLFGNFTLDENARQYVAAYAGYTKLFAAGTPLADALLKFRRQHASKLADDPNLRIGVWAPPGEPITLDLSRVFKSKPVARKFAKANKQAAVWDAKLGESFTVTKGPYEKVLEQQADVVKKGGGVWFPEMADADALGTNGAGLTKLLEKAEKAGRRTALYEFLSEKQQMAARMHVVDGIIADERAKGFPGSTKLNRAMDSKALVAAVSKIPGLPKNLKGGVEGAVRKFGTLFALGEAYAPSAETWYKRVGAEAREFAARANASGFKIAGKPMTVTQAVDLLAITSLKANPTENWKNAVKALRQFREGKALKKDGRTVHVSVDKVDKDAFELLSGRDPWMGADAKRPAYRDNILKYADPAAYARLNKGNRLTVDRHVAAAAFGKDTPSDLEYEWMRGFFNVWKGKTGKEVENLQAMMWVPQKAMNEYAKRLLRYGPNSNKVKGKTWHDFLHVGAGTYSEGMEQIGKFRSGGVVGGSGQGDTVPAMLTPGELILNRRQQRGLARVLGVGSSDPNSLFSAISGFAGGGVVRRGRNVPTFIGGGTDDPGSSSSGTVQHNTFQIPPTFNDTRWVVERALARASWEIRKGT